MQKAILGFALLAGLTFSIPGIAAAKDLKGWGVVLVHGKKGNPSRVADLASALKGAGAFVASPQMPWPGTYRSYEEVLGQIGKEVASLRSKGASRIAVVGQSIGANVALGYAATHPDLAAIVAIAPGHNPERFAKRTADSLSRAKQAVAAGNGGDIGTYTDVNQGEVFQVKATATAYISFFDPAGPAAAMKHNAEQLKGPKLLWIVGTGDDGARALARGGKTITVKGNHKNTGSAGKAELVSWLQSL